MKALRKKVYVAAGYNTMFFGPGRKEFHPKKPMRAFEDYLNETFQGTCDQLVNTDFDEGVFTNFAAMRFIRQGNLPGFLPYLSKSLKGKSCTRVEGACGSGGLGIAAAVKTILSELADSVLVVGGEIQNSMKSVYGADVLSAAGYYKGDRKDGHAYFFPGVFSDRAGTYGSVYDKDLMRQGMAKWYELAVTSSRKNPKSQEHHNSVEDLFGLGMTPPNGKIFMDHLNLFDCSKVSDGASSLVVASEEGLKKLGVELEDAIEISGFASAEGDITEKPADPTVLDITKIAAEKALLMAGITISDLAMLELHDCFSIAALIALETIGFAKKGKGAEFLLEGNTKVSGKIPTNMSGGLCGFGHPVGVSGVRQMVDLLHQLTDKAEQQVAYKNPFGMMVCMGGDDKTVSVFVTRKNQS
ncbi:MAG: 3-ketoacyl-CoA thiolase [Deltaproteobacteria bacterium]|nr:3-ketoacyl-CoA thiolase [Deltaproteobacteria bacterium]MBT4525503.1 3-ketoacyl-CoA thiolase [Deltaproteobacteria bacterium]